MKITYYFATATLKYRVEECLPQLDFITVKLQRNQALGKEDIHQACKII